MSGFAKLHASIIHSSIWQEPSHVRIVWVTMLAMADSTGTVHASRRGLAHAACVSAEECAEALATLLGPDPDSRDGTTGERIEAVAGGWQILNHQNYRERSTREQQQARLRQQRHRAAKQKKAAPDPPAEKPAAPSSQAKAEAALQFQTFWQAYAKATKKQSALTRWLRLPKADRDQAMARVADYVASTPDKRYRRDCATWLNQRGWEDEIVPPSSPPKGTYTTDHSDTDYGSFEQDI